MISEPIIKNRNKRFPLSVLLINRSLLLLLLMKLLLLLFLLRFFRCLHLWWFFSLVFLRFRFASSCLLLLPGAGWWWCLHFSHSLCATLFLSLSLSSLSFSLLTLQISHWLSQVLWSSIYIKCWCKKKKKRFRLSVCVWSRFSWSNFRESRWFFTAKWEASIFVSTEMRKSATEIVKVTVKLLVVFQWISREHSRLQITTILRE